MVNSSRDLPLSVCVVAVPLWLVWGKKEKKRVG